MAADHHHDAPAMDYAEHEKTYGLFSNLIKWGTVFCLVFTLLVGAFSGTLPWMLTLALIAALVAATVKFF